MGIPAAFRWLSNKYPKIISPVIEHQPVVMPDGSVVPVDTTGRNPNGEEFDNLYLDMNGIVHPCAHPEDKPAPEDEEEMMLEIFNYTDRVVNMVRPRKLLMIAVDGVAPRAKMNQQRSRRFRSAQDAKEKEENKQELIKLVKQQNSSMLRSEHLDSNTKKAFDNNSITPGTPFMDILAVSLRYWCQYKLNTDPAWAKIKVLISDATVPGEGEHKIMNFVRSQRASPGYDPNTRHVIYGLDADLIMLGLATHEPHFRVLREDVFFQEGKDKMCQICGEKGHEAHFCQGRVKDKSTIEDKVASAPLKPFIWLHVSVLREYLAAELAVPGLPFQFDLERAIDDWIFICCFVGNDFLPHLPALEIREHGIDTLTTIWRNCLPRMGGYVTKDGHIDLERAQRILERLAILEDGIFKRRKDQEERRNANAKRRKMQNDGHPRQTNGAVISGKGRDGHHDPSRGLSLQPISTYSKEQPPVITHDMVVNRFNQDMTAANKSAAGVMKEQLQAGKVTMDAQNSVLGKRKTSGELHSTEVFNGSTSIAGTVDTVRLWEDGYADRYYQQKFHRPPGDLTFRYEVAKAYAEGLAWVLLYYFQGCPSWEWYYPYHYAPFAADFKDLASMDIRFEKGRISRPFEQLMSVLPAASRHALPTAFHPLMTEEDSEIIDFYPEEFEVDLNGKKMAWQGVALLPFIDMPRLLAAVQGKYALLSPAEAARNAPGQDVLIISETNNDLYDDILTRVYSKRQESSIFKLNPKPSGGLAGNIKKQDSDYVPHASLTYPLGRNSMPDLDYDRSVSVYFEMPQTQKTHKSMLLRGVKLPPPALTLSDIEVIQGRRDQRGPRGPRGAGYARNNNRMSADQQNHCWKAVDNHTEHWYPPPPGAPGFGIGVPPPPPTGTKGCARRY